MDLFVSYAREDANPVESLVARLYDLGHRVWLDKQLTGGQVWWDQVLHNIRLADAVVLALSPASIASEACTYERQYAALLGKPLLPIQVATLAAETLPADLVRLQIVDYRNPNEQSAIRLARAVTSLPAAPPLAPQLPPEPPVPHSYLTGLAEQVRQPPASQEAQLALVSRLETALKSPDYSERRAAAELVTLLQARTDIFAETYHRCERLREAVLVANAPPPGMGSNVAAAPGVVSPTSATSGLVKFLAWVGAIVLILFGVALCSSGEDVPCYDYLGNEVPC